jgi:hypothetical protein
MVKKLAKSADNNNALLESPVEPLIPEQRWFGNNLRILKITNWPIGIYYPSAATTGSQSVLTCA